MGVRHLERRVKMSKAKSVIITVVLALAVAVAAFFAAISFPVANNVKRFNSLVSQIHLGAQYSGYAYTTVYPEGVITAGEYEGKNEEDKSDYQQIDGSSAYVDSEWLKDTATSSKTKAAKKCPALTRSKKR